MKILGNSEVIAIDQDPLGRPANLLRRGAGMDLLIKPPQSGAHAVAVFNYGGTPITADLRPSDLGFYGHPCDLQVQDLWTGRVARGSARLSAQLALHDTAIWRITPGPGCGPTMQQGVITRVIPDGPVTTHNPGDYARCLSSSGKNEECTGPSRESWQVLADGRLRSGDLSIVASGSHVRMAFCGTAAHGYWHYDRLGRLINRATHRCLTAAADGELSVGACEHNPASQIWSLPQPVTGEPQRHPGT